MGISHYFRRAELPAREDVYNYAGTTEWGNHDFYPIPMKERTYSWGGYFAFILVTGVNITTFTLGSSYVAYGLTAGQTLGMVFLGTFVSGCIAYISARPGLDHNMGYVGSHRRRRVSQLLTRVSLDYVPSHSIRLTRSVLSNWYNDNYRICLCKNSVLLGCCTGLFRNS